MDHIDLSEQNRRLGIEVEYMHKYLNHLQQGISTHNSEMKEGLNEDIEYAGRHNATALVDMYKNDFIKIPSYSYNSGFLLIYSLLEASLLKICKELHVQLNLPVGLEEIKGSNYFETSLKYLRTFTPLDDNLFTAGKEFTQYQKIRNNIVHNGSVINDKLSGTKNKLFAKSITYDSDGSFYINDIKFLRSFLLKVEDFVDNCISMIHKLKIVPVRLQSDGIIKYYSSNEYDKYYNSPLPIEDEPYDLPF